MRFTTLNAALVVALMTACGGADEPPTPSKTADAVAPTGYMYALLDQDGYYCPDGYTGPIPSKSDDGSPPLCEEMGEQPDADAVDMGEPADAGGTQDAEVVTCLEELDGEYCEPMSCYLVRYPTDDGSCLWDCVHERCRSCGAGDGVWPRGAPDFFVQNRCDL